VTEPIIERVAKAIADAQGRGWTSSWALARVAVDVTINCLPRHVKQSAMDEISKKSIARLRARREASKKGWVTKKRKKAASREAAQDQAGKQKAA
jgi:hypothetical protein